MSGEGGEDMGRVTGEKHKLIHYQQVRMRLKVEDADGRREKTPFHQKHNWDCGLSCVLMVLPYRDR